MHFKKFPHSTLLHNYVSGNFTLMQLCSKVFTLIHPCIGAVYPLYNYVLGNPPPWVCLPLYDYGCAYPYTPMS